MSSIDTTLRRPFRRASEGRVLGGVAAGIARHVGVDPLLVRIAFVLIPLGLVPYLLAWIVVPADGDPLARGPGGGLAAAAVGLVLISLGTVLTIEAASPTWIDFDVDGRYVGPALVIAAGLALLVRSARDRR